MANRTTNRLPPMHPGEVLREEYLEPFGLTAYALAKEIDVPRTRIERIIREEVGITADTALRLGRYFRTTPQFWLNLQATYDLRTVEAKKGKEIRAIKQREMEPV
jgi:addiction module HigA family antidote